VALALGHHADVEASVEELARGELAEGEDRSVEVQSGRLLPGRLTELGGLNGQSRPPLAPAETATDLGEGEAAGGGPLDPAGRGFAGSRYRRRASSSRAMVWGDFWAIPRWSFR
jgi:hypothetical protein